MTFFSFFVAWILTLFQGDSGGGLVLHLGGFSFRKKTVLVGIYSATSKWFFSKENHSGKGSNTTTMFHSFFQDWDNEVTVSVNIGGKKAWINIGWWFLIIFSPVLLVDEWDNSVWGPQQRCQRFRERGRPRRMDQGHSKEGQRGIDAQAWIPRNPILQWKFDAPLHPVLLWSSRDWNQ